MKILLTGGGSGGHFYPLIAIAERINTLARERKILKVELYYMSSEPYDEKALRNNNISFVYVPTGKMRLYFSWKNFIDIFKIAAGLVQAVFRMFMIYPDVVISKGGHGSIPAAFAARILRIPVITHESDTHPGRANLWIGKFADIVAVAHQDAAKYFDPKKTAIVGLPIRNELIHLPTPKEGAQYYGLSDRIPTIFIYPGSQGAEKINNLVLDSLSELLKNYQIIHQCGPKNEYEVRTRTKIILEDHPFQSRYILKPFLDAVDTRHAAALASLVICRGSSTLFEVAAWHLPAIVIPITHSNGDHQRKNAIRFAEIGAGTVIEEANALPHIFITEINDILLHPDIWKKMHDATKDMDAVDAAMEIAHEAILIGEAHELE